MTFFVHSKDSLRRVLALYTIGAAYATSFYQAFYYSKIINTFEYQKQVSLFYQVMMNIRKYR